MLGYAARLTPYIFIVGLLFALSLLAAKIALVLTGDPSPLSHLPKAFSGPTVPIACLALFAAAFIVSWRVSITNSPSTTPIATGLSAAIWSIGTRTPWPAFHWLLRNGRSAACSIAGPSRFHRPERRSPATNPQYQLERGAWQGTGFANTQSAHLSPSHLSTRDSPAKSLVELLAIRLCATSDSGSKQRGCENGISLGTAVAVSGPPPAPTWASTPSLRLAFLMTLFDVRLGWWIGKSLQPAKLGAWGALGLVFFWLIPELLGSTNDDSGFVYLSDGGHFENLAVMNW